MSRTEKKTNAMRLLEQAHICYKENYCDAAVIEFEYCDLIRT